jgi:hypothetical protein
MELGIRRGIVGSDPDFDSFVGTEMALLYPFAPSESVSEPSLYGMTVYDKAEPTRDDEQSLSSIPDNQEGLTISSDEELNFSHPLVSSPSGYVTVPSDDMADSEARWLARRDRERMSSPLEYQDLEGIYRFIELVDNARR